jgi:hypothetical protein
VFFSGHDPEKDKGSLAIFGDRERRHEGYHLLALVVLVAPFALDTVTGIRDNALDDAKVALLERVILDSLGKPARAGKSSGKYDQTARIPVKPMQGARSERDRSLARGRLRDESIKPVCTMYGYSSAFIEEKKVRGFEQHLVKTARRSARA